VRTEGARRRRVREISGRRWSIIFKRLHRGSFKEKKTMETPIEDTLQLGFLPDMNLPPPLPHEACAAHLSSHKGSLCSAACPMYATCGGGYLDDAEWFDALYKMHGLKLLCRNPKRRFHKTSNPFCTPDQFRKRIIDNGGTVLEDVNVEMSDKERVRKQIETFPEIGDSQELYDGF